MARDIDPGEAGQPGAPCVRSGAGSGADRELPAARLSSDRKRR